MARFHAARPGEDPIRYTAEEEAEADAAQALWQAEAPLRMVIVQEETTNKNSLSNSTLVNTLKNQTLPEIEAHVSDGFSNLSSMSNAEINDYIDNNVTSVESIKPILKVIAKDVSWAVKILKAVTKIAAYLIKRAI